MRLMCSVSGVIRFIRSYPLTSFGHIQNFERTPPDKDVRWMNVTRALVCGLSGSHAVCTFLMRSASCRYPLCIRWCPFDLRCERSTTRHLLEFPDKHFSHFFCPFGVRSLYPVICDSTIIWTVYDCDMSPRQPALL